MLDEATLYILWTIPRYGIVKGDGGSAFQPYRHSDHGTVRGRDRLATPEGHGERSSRQSVRHPMAALLGGFTLSRSGKDGAACGVRGRRLGGGDGRLSGADRAQQPVAGRNRRFHQSARRASRTDADRPRKAARSLRSIAQQKPRRASRFAWSNESTGSGTRL